MTAAGGGSWQPFRLWPQQRTTLAAIDQHNLIVIVKARQLGLTWLVVAYALWTMLYRPIANVLLFSKTDQEAMDMLRKRLAGMLQGLPAGLHDGRLLADSAHMLQLSNQSRALAFPTTGGRSYTGNLAVIDEADFVPDLDALIRSVKPTVDAGGKLILISTVDKAQPKSAFKRIYRAAVAGENDYAPVFLPWTARPERDAAWYAAQRRDVLARTGFLDDLFQEYPATDIEALAGRSSDKRFPAEWLTQCDGTARATALHGLGPAIMGLAIWQRPEPGRAYIIGADPAEGNPQSDESAACVLDTLTGTEVATLAGRFDPAVFGAYLSQVAAYYNGAGVLVERNNHGHAVLLWLASFSQTKLLRGPDGKPGWNETGNNKALGYDHLAETLRAGGALVRDKVCLFQLASIEGSRLSAPPGQHDDRATAFMLAQAALRFCNTQPAQGIAGTLPSAWADYTGI